MTRRSRFILGSGGGSAHPEIGGYFWHPPYAETMRSAGELADRAEAICRRALAAKALREQLIAMVGRVVPFDGYNFPMMDPVSRVFSSPLADVPGLPWPRLPELIRCRYLTPVARWDQLLDRRVAATSLLRATDNHPEDSLLWRSVQRDLGVTDTAWVVFADRFGCWAVLDLWRTAGRTFTDEELRTLGTLVPAVARGLRMAIARTFVDPEQQLHPLGPAVVILDADLQVRTQTEAAAETLLRLNPPDEPIPPIPAAAYNIAGALLAAEHEIPVGPIWSRIHLGGSRWVTVKASRLGPDIAVAIEPSTAAERLDLYARACGLSPRESETLTLLAEGSDTKEIAERLVISEHTATDHVKTVLAKTGAPTRQRLLARALGVH
jgi:DNA-binding CsgD family transcriptional regulator